MGKPTVAFMIRVVGIINIMIGAFVELFLLTVGLVTALYACSLNKTPLLLVPLTLMIALGVLFILGGIGIIRKRTRSRTYLTIVWGFSILFMAMYIFGQLRTGFSKYGIGSEAFDIWSWLGGIIFWSVVAVLGILQIRFVNNSEVKKLFI